eukprot:5275380-Pyramimonas_sp.AAC.1
MDQTRLVKQQSKTQVDTGAQSAACVDPLDNGRNFAQAALTLYRFQNATSAGRGRQAGPRK